MLWRTCCVPLGVVPTLIRFAVTIVGVWAESVGSVVFDWIIQAGWALIRL